MSAFLETCAKYGNDQHTVISGCMAFEAWIDNLVDREINSAVSRIITPDSKLRLT
jgi:hypothetical protein